jgi:phosphatidylglycerophosphate synthase
MVDSSEPRPADRVEPTGAGCLLVVMSAEVLLVEILVVREQHISTALAFMAKHPMHGQRGGWFGGAVLALNVVAIGFGLLFFKLGSLLLRIGGVPVWKAAAEDPHRE